MKLKTDVIEKHILFVFGGGTWPLPNVIHGYSAATQADLDRGIADLLATPSALRCLSLEPLVGPIDLRIDSDVLKAWNGDPVEASHRMRFADERAKALHWVIVGGESGHEARPCDVAWIRSIRDQCKTAGVPCFVKQDFGPRPGMQGRLPDDLWIKEFPSALQRP